MRTMDEILKEIGDEILDAEEETFCIFAQARTDQGLGMVDGAAETIEVTVADRDYNFVQSPGLLKSSRREGTTGGAIWKASIHTAEWLASDNCPLQSHPELCEKLSTFTVAELGCGISPLIALMLHQKTHRYIATDQDYVLKYYSANLQANIPRSARSGATKRQASYASNVELLPLDWEKHDIPKQLQQHLRSSTKDGCGSMQGQLDMIVACDCVFNEHLVIPFVEACAAICNINQDAFCVVVQQVRSSEVLELWMKNMLKHFRLFKLNEHYASSELCEPAGFVVHFATLKGS